MRRLTSIVAMSHDGAIGTGNALPWRLKADLLFFKKQTLDNVVIMGRRTYDSLGRKPLPNRMNVVLTHSFGLFAQADNCKAALSVEEGLWAAEKSCDKLTECFVIGGASMYQQFSPYVDRYLITLVDKNIPEADTFVHNGIFDVIRSWNSTVLQRVSADGIENEADFSILEFHPPQPEAILRHREEAIQQAKRLSGSRAAGRTVSTKRQKPAGQTSAAVLF